MQEEHSNHPSTRVSINPYIQNPDEARRPVFRAHGFTPRIRTSRTSAPARACRVSLSRSARRRGWASSATFYTRRGVLRTSDAPGAACGPWGGLVGRRRRGDAEHRVGTQRRWTWSTTQRHRWTWFFGENPVLFQVETMWSSGGFRGKKLGFEPIVWLG